MPGQALSAVLHQQIQIDIDAISAYTRAIDNCGDDGSRLDDGILDEWPLEPFAPLTRSGLQELRALCV